MKNDTKPSILEGRLLKCFPSTNNRRLRWSSFGFLSRVIQVYERCGGISISIVKPTRCINVANLFYWSNTQHVSDGLSVQHQELKTVHTATDICQTDTADCLLVFPLASSQQYLFDICLLQYVQSLTPDDGR